MWYAGSMNYSDTISKFFEVLRKQYPVNKRGHHYMTLSNGRKCFLNIFIKKYGLSGGRQNYSKDDIRRRMKFIEIIDTLAAKHKVVFDKIDERGQQIYTIDSEFFRIIIADTKKGHAMRMELISFYPK